MTARMNIISGKRRDHRHEIKSFKKAVQEHYRKNGRILPWRKTSDPYKILVSEIMLQQTQVARVIPKYSAWIKKFPTLSALSKANLQEVLKLWMGLGYNRRARALYTIARLTKRLPTSIEELEKLPGIGHYTARAIATFAYNQSHAFIETNIRTAYIHHFFRHTNSKISDKQLLSYIEETLDTDNPRVWYWALMDYGAYIKQTYGNPNIKSNQYRRQSTFKGSLRQLRASILTYILNTTSCNIDSILSHTKNDERTQLAIDGLKKDNLITEHNDLFNIS